MFLRKVADRALRLRRSNALRCAFLIFASVFVFLRDLANQPSRIPVKVCLTTYPARAAKVWPTLLSLALQDVRCSGFVLVLSDEEYGSIRDLPWSIRLIAKMWPDLSFQFDEGNARSYKKIVPAILLQSGTGLVTVDDDVIYSYSWLRRLWEAHLAHPGCIVGARGNIAPHGFFGAPGTSAKMGQCNTDTASLVPYAAWAPAPEGAKSDDILLTGVGGILYPPGALDASAIETRSFLAVAPFADDIWLKVLSMRRGWSCFVVKDGMSLYAMRRLGLRQGLWVTNVSANQNDEALAKVLAYFGSAK